MPKKLKLKFLKDNYSVVQLPQKAVIPDWLDTGTGFVSVTRTADELSIVCRTDSIPAGCTLRQNRDWLVIKIEEVLDFSLCGILYSLLKVLKEKDISVYTISTFNTDYVLIKAGQKNKAVKHLSNCYDLTG